MPETRASKKGAGRAKGDAETTVERGPAREPVCPVAFCPVGMALTSLQPAGQETIEHLLAAAREFLLAAKAVIDARAEGLGPRRTKTLERIEIA